MSIPTVKSDPWKRGVKKRRIVVSCDLWPAAFWKKLEENAQDGGRRAPFSGSVLEMISRENLAMYGRA